MNTQAKVVITVVGGVADIFECPDWIDVEIRDYDNCESCDNESPYESDHCADYCPEHSR